MAIELVIPNVGITVEMGKVVRWMKKEGDAVEKEETIFVVETDKVVTEVESPAAGILAKILIPEDVEVPIATVVGVLTEPGEELPAEYAARPMEVPSAEAEVVFQVDAESAAAPFQPAPAAPGVATKVIPAARKLAQDKGLDWKTITGSGPEGVIVVRDVEAALKAKEAAAPGLGRVIPMDSMHRIIARRMSESAFTAPHIYFFTDVWMDPLLDFRQDILLDFEQQFGLRPSINDLLVKIVALNILDFPLLNATLKGEEIHILPEVNIGLAVALPDGLIVPAIANADKAGLVEIARQREDLVFRARSGKLSLDEIRRGSFTVSSLSKYDVTCFTAILNPPQSGILSVGKTRDELALVDGEVKARRVATFGLSVDHRIIDGTVAADFLQNLKWKLERPATWCVRADEESPD